MDSEALVSTIILSAMRSTIFLLEKSNDFRLAPPKKCENESVVSQINKICIRVPIDLLEISSSNFGDILE